MADWYDPMPTPTSMPPERSLDIDTHADFETRPRRCWTTGAVRPGGDRQEARHRHDVSSYMEFLPFALILLSAAFRSRLISDTCTGRDEIVQRPRWWDSVLASTLDHATNLPVVTDEMLLR